MLPCATAPFTIALRVRPHQPLFTLFTSSSSSISAGAWEPVPGMDVWTRQIINADPALRLCSGYSGRWERNSVELQFHVEFWCLSFLDTDTVVTLPRDVQLVLQLRTLVMNVRRC